MGWMNVGGMEKFLDDYWGDGKLLDDHFGGYSVDLYLMLEMIVFY